MYVERSIPVTPEAAAALRNQFRFSRYLAGQSAPFLKIALLLAVASPAFRLVPAAYRCGGFDAACVLQGFDTAYHLKFALAIFAIGILAALAFAVRQWSADRKRLERDIAAGQWFDCALTIGPRHLLVADEDEPLLLVPAEGQGTRIFRVSPYREDPRLEAIERTQEGDQLRSVWTWTRTMPSGAILGFEAKGAAIPLNPAMLWDDCVALDDLDIGRLVDGTVVPEPFEHFAAPGF